MSRTAPARRLSNAPRCKILQAPTSSSVGAKPLVLRQPLGVRSADQDAVHGNFVNRGGPGDVAFNTANSRNRRIFNDPAGLAAGRNQRSYLIQSYARDMGNGKTVMMREIDVPIRVNGRHWGGFRTAYKL